jgi:hypothetical protein
VIASKAGGAGDASSYDIRCGDKAEGTSDEAWGVSDTSGRANEAEKGGVKAKGTGTIGSRRGQRPSQVAVTEQGGEGGNEASGAEERIRSQ